LNSQAEGVRKGAQTWKPQALQIEEKRWEEETEKEHPGR
jgi:hypothetical protein